MERRTTTPVPRALRPMVAESGSGELYQSASSPPFSDVLSSGSALSTDGSHTLGGPSPPSTGVPLPTRGSLADAPRCAIPHHRSRTLLLSSYIHLPRPLGGVRHFFSSPSASALLTLCTSSPFVVLGLPRGARDSFVLD